MVEERSGAKEQSRNYFTLRELVDMLLATKVKKPSDVWAVEKTALWERVRREALAGHLRVRHPETFLVEDFAEWAEPSCYALVTSLDDADAWLADQGAPYRLQVQAGGAGRGGAIDKELEDQEQCAPDIFVNRIRISTTKKDNLAPVIEKAISESKTDDTATVFNCLRNWAQKAEGEKPQPLLGVTNKGIQWVDSNDEPQELSKHALGGRLRRWREKKA